MYISYFSLPPESLFPRKKKPGSAPSDSTDREVSHPPTEGKKNHVGDDKALATDGQNSVGIVLISKVFGR